MNILTGPGSTSPAPADAWRWKQFLPNLLRYITPQLVTGWLEQFDRGWIRNLSVMIEQIIERDDILAIDVRKRLDAIASRAAAFQVVVDRDAPDKAEADKHAEALRFFYKNVIVTDATDLNVEGDIRMLAYQMTGALIYKYAFHEIVWRISPRGLSADLKFVPSYFFETTRGVGRYTGPIGGLGQPTLPQDPWKGPLGSPQPANEPRLKVAPDVPEWNTKEGQWLVSTAPGIGKALCILYIVKSMGIRDMVNYSGRFGVPIIHGSAPFAFGTPEWDDFINALLRMSNDGVIATTKSAIAGMESPTVELIEAGTSGEIVPEKLVERCDRRMSSLILGADMRTMSRKQQGPGVSIQGDEADAMIEGDCEWLTATLRQKLDKRVIALVFGEGVEPMAHIEISPRADKSLARELPIDTFLLQSGFPMTVGQAADRYDRELPDGVDPDQPMHAPTPTGQSPEEILADQQAVAATKEPAVPGSNAASNDYHPDQHRDYHGRWTAGSTVEPTSKGAEARKGHMRPATSEDIKHHGIAPSYKDAHVTDDPHADLLATAKTPAGKTVYYYSDKYKAAQEAAKFKRIESLHRDLPKLLEKINHDIRSGSADKQKALTSSLIIKTGLRNGGEDGGGRVKAYGASSLRTEHAKTEGDRVHLDFIGKEGIRQRHSLTDKDLAEHIRERQAGGHEKLFDHDAGKTLNYLSKISGDKYKVHDLRTYHGTALGDAVMQKLKARGELDNIDEKGMKKIRNRVGDVVARELGNARSMALANYIHPEVFTPK